MFSYCGTGGGRPAPAFVDPRNCRESIEELLAYWEYQKPITVWLVKDNEVLWEVARFE